MHYRIIVIFCITASVSCQELRCYECDPKSPGNCESLDNTTSTLCSESPETSGSGATKITEEVIKIGENSTEPFCYYLYFDAGIPDQTGYYRGCSKKSEGILAFCEVLTQNMRMKIPNCTMIGCQVCSVSDCNVGNFKKVDFDVTVRPGNTRGKTLLNTVDTKGGAESNVFLGGYRGFFVFCWFYFLNKILF